MHREFIGYRVPSVKWFLPLKMILASRSRCKKYKRRNFQFIPITIILLFGTGCVTMISLRCCYKTVHVAPLKYQKRKQSMYHRCVQFFFKKNLLLTNSITSGACMTIGDLIQQEIEFQMEVSSSRFDWARAGRTFTVGMMLGPLHHYYYIKIDQVWPKSNINTVMKKISADQLVASPLTIIAFFYGMNVLERKSIKDSTDELKNKFLYVYMGDCCFWPPIQFINFYFLPTHYRVLYINVATMVFNIFMSFMKHYDRRGV